MQRTVKKGKGNVRKGTRGWPRCPGTVQKIRGQQFVGVSSRHRQNAFDSCNFIMDWLKTKATFWKVEENEHQKKWVDYNLSDDEATKKWSIQDLFYFPLTKSE